MKQKKSLSQQVSHKHTAVPSSQTTRKYQRYEFNRQKQKKEKRMKQHVNQYGNKRCCQVHFQTPLRDSKTQVFTKLHDESIEPKSIKSLERENLNRQQDHSLKKFLEILGSNDNIYINNSLNNLNEGITIETSRIQSPINFYSDNCINAQRKSRKEFSRKISLHHLRSASSKLVIISNKFSSPTSMSNQLANEQSNCSHILVPAVSPGIKNNTNKSNLKRKSNQLPIHPEANLPTPVTQMVKLNSELLSNKIEETIQIKLSEHSQTTKEKETLSNPTNPHEPPRRTKVQRTGISKSNHSIHQLQPTISNPILQDTNSTNNNLPVIRKSSPTSENSGPCGVHSTEDFAFDSNPKTSSHVKIKYQNK